MQQAYALNPTANFSQAVLVFRQMGRPARARTHNAG